MGIFFFVSLVPSFLPTFLRMKDLSDCGRACQQSSLPAAATAAATTKSFIVKHFVGPADTHTHNLLLDCLVDLGFQPILKKLNADA